MKCPTVMSPAATHNQQLLMMSWTFLRQQTLWLSEGMDVIHMFFIEKEFGEGGGLLLNHWEKT